MKTVAIIQARMGSTRLPNKVMERVGGKPMIGFLMERLSKAAEIDEIVLATSRDAKNDPLVAYVEQHGFPVFRGNEDDVLDRYYHAAKEFEADVVVRITGDCPFIDPRVVDEVVRLYHSSDTDYVSNVDPPTFPDGLDTEVFSFASLKRAWSEAKEPSQREHVTSYLRTCGKFKTTNYANPIDYSHERWTVDEPEDLEVIRKIAAYFEPDLDFRLNDVLDLKKNHPEWFEANKDIARNEGALMGTGQKLWRRAKRVIPGGNMLLSKRAEMFLPEQWPAYFSKAKGCHVWDLDGNEYIDVSIMGIGTNILGYGHPEVDEAVRQVVDKGNMSTFNCPEEVYLAEKLVEMHPWADMVRLARTGGEANAICIRIARAAAGRDKVALCGYHGWHDWYLAANLGDSDELAGHLLPGLAPSGVPRGLRGSVLPFAYNDLDALEKIVEENDIGVIKMEVSRSEPPAAGFLEAVRDLATKQDIILVFDECTSGFRQAFGGLHKIYGVDPDMAVLGKALGNGYGITAVIGRRDIMEAAQNTFISSTFWTERIGPAAALKTLEVMERERSWDVITNTGKNVGKKWENIAEKYDLPIIISGLPALIGFRFPLPNMQKYRTLITQEMLKRKYLAATSIYVCIEHTPEVIESYCEELDDIFQLIASCEKGQYDIDSLLRGPVCHNGFKRLS